MIPSDSTIAVTSQIRDILSKACHEHECPWPTILDDTGDTGPWEEVARAIEQHVAAQSKKTP